MAPHLNDIFIVSKVNGNDVEMTHFYNLIRGDETSVKTLSMKGILKQAPLIGEDGLEVSLRLGEMLFITGTPPMIHLANCGPNTDEGHKQFQIALFKLGLNDVEPMYTHDTLAADGQFRKLLSGKKGLN